MEPPSFQNRYDQFRGLDSMRDKLIKDLITALEHLKEKEKELASAMDRNTFISVLIDGSSIMPHEHLVRQGREGGKTVAQSLFDSIINYIQQQIPSISHVLRIAVRIYASAGEITRALGRSDEAGYTETVTAFMHGFASSNSLFDFIDTETAEQGAEKLKETFNLHVNDCHCKQVILGFSANSDFHTTFTDIYNDNPDISNRTTILTNSASDFESGNLKGKFKTTTFHRLFQAANAKPNNSRNTSSGQDSISKGSAFRLLGLYSSTTAPTTTAGSMLTLIDSSISSTTDSSVGGPPSPPEPPKQFFIAPPLLHNSKGQRLDPPLTVSDAVLTAIKGRTPKLCNSFYLRGRCMSKDCPRDHAYCPNQEEVDAIRTLARQAPCKFSYRCREEWCFFGHNCPWNCVRESCKFRDVHGIDLRVVEPLLSIEGED